MQRRTPTRTKRRRTYLTALLITASLSTPRLPALAQRSSTGPLIDIENRLEVIGRKAYNQQNLIGRSDTQGILIQRIAAVIAIFLGFLGIVFIIFVLYGGWLWMTAAGNDERVKEAQRVIRNAVFGVIVVGVSYALTAFVISSVVSATKFP